MHPVTAREYETLADIRYRMRRFLVFSETTSRASGLEPQQHQLLLAVRGLPAELVPSIGTLAERLQIQHHSAVELVNRCVENGMVAKRSNESDRRQVLVVLTPRGKRLLEKISIAHRGELHAAAPELIAALEALMALEGAAS